MCLGDGIVFSRAFTKSREPPRSSLVSSAVFDQPLIHKWIMNSSLRERVLYKDRCCAVIPLFSDPRGYFLFLCYLSVFE